MPRYEYRCENGHRTEQQRAVEDRDNPASCLVQLTKVFQVCGAPLKRRFNSPGFSIDGRAFLEYRGDANDLVG